MEQVDVLIVGAGPAGLTAALLLARKGIHVHLVERREGTSFHPKARGLNVRTMEILRSLGLQTQVEKAGEPLRKSRYMLFVDSLAGQEIRRIPDEDLMMQGEALEQYTPCTWVQCAQDVLERLLAEEAQKAGAELRFNTSLVSFEQDATGVTCRLSGKDGPEMRRATFLLACDGAKSLVREQLGIELAGRAAIEHFINVYFEAELRSLVEDRWFGICFVEGAEVRGLFLPVDNDRRWLFNIEYDPAVVPIETFTPERCRELVQAAIGDPAVGVTVLSALPWVASSLAAPHLRRGGVFLLGDAGHILPPAGGFGLNLAVQDAHNLAWKIGGVLRGELAAAILDSYEAERAPAAAAVAQYSEREMDADQPWDHAENPASGEVPDETTVAERGANPWEKSLEEQLEAVIGFRYTSQAIAPSFSTKGLHLNAAPGTRFPHVRLEDGRSTLDLLTPGFTVFVREGVREEGLPPNVTRVSSSLWARLTDRKDVDAILVRPDQVVAAAGSIDHVEHFLVQLTSGA